MDFKLFENQIHIVVNYTYLGVVFAENGSIACAIVAGKASKAAYVARKGIGLQSDDIAQKKDDPLQVEKEINSEVMKSFGGRPAAAKNFQQHFQSASNSIGILRSAFDGTRRPKIKKRIQSQSLKPIVVKSEQRRLVVIQAEDDDDMKYYEEKCIFDGDDFEFVRVVNRKIKQIDGSPRIDGRGITQIYPHGAVSIRVMKDFCIFNNDKPVEEELQAEKYKTKKYMVGSDIPTN
ncbi:uncharacterized protein LOC144347620 [Saccoglossus kowalevskii]